jgi:hypothetical protein
MPRSIPPGLTTEHILHALADLDNGVEHPFGEPTGYELVREGKRYPPKAVIGLAFRYLTGALLSPDEFSGGEAPGQANHVLRGLGFSVLKKDVNEADDETKSGRDWTANEVRLIVADYFDMLRLDLADRPFNKSEHNRALRELLDDRSKSSVEFKHQNISAVLLDMGLPYIDGYKPARNYQRRLLPAAVAEYLAAHPVLQEELAASPILNPEAEPIVADGDVGSYFVSPPDRAVASPGDAKPWLSRRGHEVDYASRDALNRRLGIMGERFSLEVERKRLLAAGRDDLAARVEWVSHTCGDGLGFDILSFDENDDGERYLEIKTTGLGLYFPFVVTENERRCSDDVGERYHLYRVFDFARRPRLYVLSGALSKTCLLDPIQYRARAVGG